MDNLQVASVLNCSLLLMASRRFRIAYLLAATAKMQKSLHACAASMNGYATDS